MNIFNMEIDIKDVELVRETKNSKIKIKISENLENKIRILASEFPRNEWSGVLFYKLDNDKKFNERTYTAIDALPMNIGYETYTKFCSDDMRIPQFIVENGYDDDGIFMGLIHSHPTFSTSASATDFNTMKVECFERGVFMSLIVNNEGTYSAYMSRKIVKTLDVECKKVLFDFNGNNKIENSSIKNKTVCIIECFDVKVEKEEKKYPGYEDFFNDIKDLYKKSDLIRNPYISFGQKAASNVGLFDDFFNNESNNNNQKNDNHEQFDKVNDLITYYDDNSIDRLCSRLDIEESKILGVVNSFTGKGIQSFTRYSIPIIGKDNISVYDILYLAILESFNMERNSSIDICRCIVNSMDSKSFADFVVRVKKYQMYSAITIFIDERQFDDYSDMAKAEFLAKCETESKKIIEFNDDEEIMKELNAQLKNGHNNLIDAYDLVLIVRLLYSLYKDNEGEVESIIIKISKWYYNLINDVICFDLNESKVYGLAEMIGEVYDYIDSSHIATVLSSKYELDSISYDEVEGIINNDNIPYDERSVIALIYVYFNINDNYKNWYSIYSKYLLDNNICVSDLLDNGING